MKRTLLLLACVVVSLIMGCPSQPPPAARPVAPAPKVLAEHVTWRLSTSGLGFRLSNAEEDADGRAVAPPAVTGPLSDDEINRLLARLDPIKSQPADKASFALRDKSLPPPRTGTTIRSTFPPPPGPPPVTPTAQGPLKIHRRAPEGDVDLAPYLSVTFSQPMVAITSHDDLAKAPVPVQLSPMPKGTWRWVGTQTAIFQPVNRFPMATDYQVEIAAGTRSASGQELPEAESWAFSTPTVRAESYYPSGSSVKLEPVVVVSFDQRIEPEAVFPTLRLNANGGEVPIRLATIEELAADPQAGRLWERAEDGRRIALRAVEPLPRNASITLQVGPGTPSAEGPKRTEKPQIYGFRTYGPLKVSQSNCEKGGECAPLSAWAFHFSNSLDSASFSPSMIRVEPELPAMRVQNRGGYLSIQGRSRGKTTYKVTFDSAIRDVYGQNLEASESFEIRIGSARPTLVSRDHDMAVLDPAGGPHFSVYSVNHPTLKLKLYSVAPEDYGPWLEWLRTWDEDRKVAHPPGRLVVNKSLAIRRAPDELVETQIDLTPALRGGFGQVIVVVEPPVQPKETWYRERVRAWVQVTKLGLDAFADAEELIGWVSSLETGAPIKGAEISLLGPGQTATTGADGLARISLAQATGTMLVARQGKDLAMLAGAAWRSYRRHDELAWYVFDDRKMYKPKEQVKVKGWIRRLENRKGGDVSGLPEPAGSRVNYSVLDPRGNQIGVGETQLDASGGFDIAFKLPDNTNLGTSRVSLNLDTSADVRSTTYVHLFEVQEFRRPEFEVNLAATEGPHFVGGHSVATVEATYYAGGGLPNAETTYHVTSSVGHFTPPERDDFHFGQAEPWSWRWRQRPSDARDRTENWSAVTDRNGKHGLRIDFDATEPPYPMNVAIAANVTDVNRQTWAAHSQLLVHPSRVYTGIRASRAFVREGEPILIEAIASDIDGKLLSGRKLSLRCARVEWVPEGDEYVEKEFDVQTCDIQSAGEPQPCKFDPKGGGIHRVAAVVEDDNGRRNQSDLRVWVVGRNATPERELVGDEVKLIPAKKEFRGGDTAEILVMAPFFPAEGLFTLRRQGLVHVERFKMDSATYTLRAAIVDGFVPGVEASVELVGAAARENDRGEFDASLPKRPAFASGQVRLSVPPGQRVLQVNAIPRQSKVAPGASTIVDIDVRDAAGRGARGEVALVVVDEAVLSLTGYQLRDPIELFYAARAPGVQQRLLRSSMILANPDLSRVEMAQLEEGQAANGYGGRNGSRAKMPVQSAAPAPMATGGARLEASKRSGASQPKVAVRKEFAPLAAFVPRVVLDAKGRAEVPVKLPDSLTRYRVMAVAVAGDKQFGKGESSITARLPLMVRPSAPRFLNFGDRFELPIVLQNQTDDPLQVDLAARTSNATLTQGAGRRVQVPANDRVEVRLPAAAARPGRARFQIVATAGDFADASEIDLPVWTPATTEAFATYGQIDQGAIAQPVTMPSGVVREFGGLELTVSSTALHALTDAVLYLVSYPFDCNEQLASRILAVAALRDVLTAFEASGMPSNIEMLAAVERDMDRLQRRQHWSGGWDYWRSDRTPSPYVSLHVAHALQRAKEKGFKVPADVLTKAHRFIQNIERHIPADYSEETRRALVSYALYIRDRLGDRDVAQARNIIRKAGGVEQVPLEALGWLMPVLSGSPDAQRELAGIHKHLANRVSETAGAAHFTTSYSDGAHVLLHSDRRADGILLESLIGDDPKNDLITKLVTGLLSHRKAGRWLNTQENAWVLLALDKYFQTYEKTPPEFVARAWLGHRFAGERAFQGYNTDRYHVKVPMAAVAEVGSGNLTVQKDGAGRLYYRIGMQYAPADLRPPPADHGFAVSRTYEGVDRPDDVRRDSDGAWRIKSGAKVRVRVNLVAPARRYHVALVDPIPAGMEAINSALRVSESVPEARPSNKQQGWWWSRAWYEHQNMRDERVEAFSSLLWEGDYEYVYVARATTPGSFVVPPARAEEMYNPETFGRSAGDRVIIE